MAAAKAAFALGFVHTSIAPVWPPSGIALAAVLLFGYRAAAPGVFLGAFLFNALTPVPLWVSLAMGVGNTLEAVAGAWLLRRAGFRREIDRVRDVLALAGLAALVSTAVSASAGVGSLWLGGIVSGGDVPAAWAVWWLGDASLRPSMLDRGADTRPGRTRAARRSGAGGAGDAVGLDRAVVSAAVDSGRPGGDASGALVRPAGVSPRGTGRASQEGIRCESGAAPQR